LRKEELKLGRPEKEGNIRKERAQSKGVHKECTVGLGTGIHGPLPRTLSGLDLHEKSCRKVISST
jgi:hypothetical protein